MSCFDCLQDCFPSYSLLHSLQTSTFHEIEPAISHTTSGEPKQNNDVALEHHAKQTYSSSHYFAAPRVALRNARAPRA